jgi:hypothetical protein
MSRTRTVRPSGSARKIEAREQESQAAAQRFDEERLTIRLHARGLAAGTTRPYFVCVLKPHGERCVRDVLRGSKWDTRPWRILAREGRNGRYTSFVRIGRHIVLKKSLRIYE